MKKTLKEIRVRFSRVLSELEEVSPRLKSVEIPDSGGYKESSSMLIDVWLPRGRWMLKKLDAMIDKVPKEPREKKKLVEKQGKTPKKLSLRLLQLSKLINPNEIEVIWSSGRKSCNSRDELAHILKEVRKLERK